MKTAIAYLCCDRPELIRQTLPPIIDGSIKQQYHTYIIDGSSTKAGEDAVFELGYPTANIRSNVRGGAGAAIVFALTTMLQHQEGYDYVGLCEADVLLPVDWYSECFALFSRGRDDGFEVGAVSSRCYEDRILIQRDGYAVCHNLGAGHIVFTRVAAELVLKTFRTAWSLDNRRIFGQLSGTDIGTYWAFRTNEHALTADFHWDAVLAANGLASLALTPSPVEMVGQDPPLDQQGLKIVTEPRGCDVLSIYAESLADIRAGNLTLGIETQFQFDPGTAVWTYFPHQMHLLGGKYEGDWRLKELRGWGTFGWISGAGWENHPGEDAALQNTPTLTVPVFGAVSVLVSGGKDGGKVEVIDEASGFRACPALPPEGTNGSVLQMLVPAAISYRNIRITALSPGIVFYGLQTREKQPYLPNETFDYSVLPLP